MKSWTVSRSFPENVDKQSRGTAGSVALGGILAALAVVIMTLGGMIPVATYVIPVLCSILLNIVLMTCGRRIAWAWYGAVAILGLLLGPDKEAAMVFLAVGSYPLLKKNFERSNISVVLKFLFFNGMILLSYFAMIYLLGMQNIAQENMQFGMIGLILILLLGNVTFFLLDKLLDVVGRKLR